MVDDRSTNIVIDSQNLTLIGALLYYIGLKHAIDNLDDADKSKEEKEKEDDKPSSSKAKANWTFTNAVALFRQFSLCLFTPSFLG